MEFPKLPSSLEDALILSLPPSAYYIPNFITEAEEANILHKINTQPLPTWRTLSHRRLQAHPSPLSPSNTLLAALLPSWLVEPVIPRLLSLPLRSDRTENIFSNAPHAAPNHCLINEYLPGQGIHAHEDGKAYYPVVCTVSLGSHIVLDITRKNAVDEQQEAVSAEIQKWRILQEPRSLLVTTGEVYKECLHGLEGVEEDEDLHGAAGGVVNWNLIGHKGAFAEGKKRREIRTSLTFRDVLKVKRLGKAFTGLAQR
ncbi:MAG: hypothetical protein Q9163_001507 [Psora crenata]